MLGGCGRKLGYKNVLYLLKKKQTENGIVLTSREREIHKYSDAAKKVDPSSHFQVSLFMAWQVSKH